MSKKSQQWILAIKPDVKAIFDLLQPGHQRSIFQSLEQILHADDPYLLAFVSKIKDKEFDGIRKFRVGNYRILFRTVPGDITHQKHRYKGKVRVIAIVNRRDAY